MRWTHPLFVMTLLVLLLLSGQGSSLKMPVHQENPILRVQDYVSLQAAINAAGEGATIQIAPGVYVGNLIIRKSVRLEGSGTEATFLEPVLGFRNPDGFNPIISVQSSQGRDIKLSLANLTLRQPPQPSEIPFSYGSFDDAVGIQVEGPDDSVSILADGTYWTRLRKTIESQSRLRRLEIHESKFERNSRDGGLVAQEAEIVRNIFIECGIGIRSQRLRVVSNTITGTYSGGIALGLEPGGVGEVLNNLIAAGTGIFLSQPDREKVTWIVRKNRLIRTSDGIHVNSHTNRNYFDVLIEENNVVNGNIGIAISIPGYGAGEETQGEIRLRRNHVTMSLLNDIWGVGQLPFFGHGISINILSTAWPEDPLTIELTENRIDYHEGWGVAINHGIDSDTPDRCVISEKIEGKEIIPPKIIGGNNIIRENGKGDLCPADYPWPPGFKKP